MTELFPSANDSPRSLSPPAHNPAVKRNLEHFPDPRAFDPVQRTRRPAEFGQFTTVATRSEPGGNDQLMKVESKKLNDVEKVECKQVQLRGRCTDPQSLQKDGLMEKVILNLELIRTLDIKWKY